MNEYGIDNFKWFFWRNFHALKCNQRSKSGDKLEFCELN
ncbi:hypothetical protein A33Q_2618 [Indibacter alkaliphilus LW1]|uniref:Uncharacterized protein n=1 Tax=Indibacter alkaliphilus (strain CCUG 57479 / KCTC 22604 / LW1) TaxID=1189612 RepID=S2DG35_INDAL|nr:hypothetical protein A33Q_2618 [Indibacter alkaliphilus LW1]